MKHYALLLAPILFLGCPIEPVVPPPNPPVDTDWCGRMCEHLKGLGCEEGEGVYNNDKEGPVGEPNQTCQEWCEEMQDPNHLYFINPRCVATVPDCDSIEEYRQKEPDTCNAVVPAE